MLKRVLSILICLVLLLSVFAGCGSNSKVTPSEATKEVAAEASSAAAETTAAEPAAKTFDKKLKITASSLNLAEGSDFQDPMMKYFQEKFNVEFELFPVGWGDWKSKTSVWIASGEMPDITFWNYNYSDYVNFSKQGSMRALPDGFETEYPNLEAVLKLTKLADFAKAKMDNKLYMVPKVIFKDLEADVVTNHLSIWYRKDWAKQVGIEIGNTISFKQIEELTKAFQEKDPGGNGAGNTVGFATDPKVMTQVYMPAFNQFWQGFYKKADGSFAWGPQEPATLEGLKYMQQLYKSGVYYKDFYTIKSESDYWQLFYSGKTGMIAGSCYYGFPVTVHNTFTASNPGKNSEDCIGAAVFTDNNGKWNGNEQTNYWAATIFNPSMDDEKMDRILSIMDYIATEEGQELVNLGFEGKDYTKANGKITVTREKDDKGVFKPMNEVYPSYWVFAMMVVLTDNFGINDPGVPEKYTKQVTELYDIRSKGNIRPIDWDLGTFSAPNYSKFQLTNRDNLSEAFTQLILKEGDLEKNWNEWVNSVSVQVNDSLKEINDTLGSK